MRGGGEHCTVHRMRGTCRCPYCGGTFHLDTNPVERVSAQCKRCGHVWNLRSSNPKRCPSCGSTNWNADVGNYTCKQCNHSWTSRTASVPRKCPRCQSLSWDKEPIIIEPKKKGDIPAEIEERVVECHEKGMGLFNAAMALDLPVLNVLAVYRKHGWF